jgi:hypothetical protein
MKNVLSKVLHCALGSGLTALCACSSLFDGTFSSVPVAPEGPYSVDASPDSTLPLDSGAEDSAEGGDAPDAPPCMPVADGLVAHFTMDVASISGTRLADSSGNHSDGTLVGFLPPETAPGRFGDALVYPATAMAYVEVPALALDQSPGAMNTVSLWFYRGGSGIDDVLALLPDSPRYDLWLTGAAGNYLCINTGQNECVGVEDDNLRSRWVHVVAIFANGSTSGSELYVDGENRDAACIADAGFSACDVTSAVAAPVYFGGKSDFFFHGMLDEVRVYSRALDATEVSVLYSGTACP